MATQRPRKRSTGELAAYQMGVELGLNIQPARVQRRLRREVHISEDSLVLIEEETTIEERYY